MSMFQGLIGPRTVTGDGTSNAPITLSRDSSLRSQDAHARYQEAILRGNCYILSVAAATPVAYTGGAAGQPLLAIHNPTGSNKVLVAILAALGITTDTTATTTSTTGQLEAYFGVSTKPSATPTAPTNLLTGNPTGSVALGFSNVVLTGSSALSFAMPLSYYTARSNATIIVAEELGPSFIEIAGMLVAVPGSEIAVGWRAVPAGIQSDLALIWEEFPYP